ncbi:hypothetical protein [Cupriavidus cauae]|uniref:Uncharacterized protein n=1 Tax=Cupriavidus cauae TaxID=2608999 RepID=A0A5M8ASW8_9BURK|nr:hypothetical protein [Cupriavidus cauae]KAA6125185.1 hypothetical protein F1599_10300 [Cupriavidus cauae]
MRESLEVHRFHLSLGVTGFGRPWANAGGECEPGIVEMRGIEQAAKAFARAGRARSDGRLGVG